MKTVVPLTVFALMLLAASHCGKSGPPPDQTSDRFVRIYLQYLERVSSDSAGWENRGSHLARALEDNGMDRETFEKELRSLTQQPAELDRIMNRIEKELQALAGKKRMRD